jgi:hypothetical protein
MTSSSLLEDFLKLEKTVASSKPAGAPRGGVSDDLDAFIKQAGDLLRSSESITNPSSTSRPKWATGQVGSPPSSRRPATALQSVLASHSSNSLHNSNSLHSSHSSHPRTCDACSQESGKATQAALFCQRCDVFLCKECDERHHALAKMRLHERTPAERVGPADLGTATSLFFFFFFFFFNIYYFLQSPFLIKKSFDRCPVVPGAP